MAWFCNHYRCGSCGCEWSDEWSSTCEDDCPECGERHMTPYVSDDLTEIIEEQDGECVVLRSPDSAEDSPDYEEVDVICERSENSPPS
jgi:hypothetical protein